MNNTRSNRALNTIQSSAGRFFGLETGAEVINARLVSFGPSLITVEDRNTGRMRRFSKDQVKAVTFKGSRYTASR
jgi:hypothetical protein